MKRYSIFRNVILLALAAWMVSCEQEMIDPVVVDDDITVDDVYADPYVQAAEFLRSQVDIAENAEVTIYGPFSNDILVKEEVTADQDPVYLLVPGGNYFFFIDDYPGLRFSHTVRYASVDLQKRTTEVIDAEWRPVFEGEAVQETMLSLSESFVAGGTRFLKAKGTGSAIVHDVSGKPEARLPQLAPNRCVKVGLVIDLGDHKDEDNAEQFAKDADGMAEFLRDNNFSVQRVSQYHDNAQSRLPGSKTNPTAMRDKLRDIILAYATQLQCVEPDCCHEFFLYLGGHGNAVGVEISDAAGSAEPEFLSYQSLHDWLANMLPCVKIIVFIDACKSGGAIAALGDLCNGRDCGMTIITTTDSKHNAAVGTGLTDSGTEDFLEGTGDTDGDGKKGDSGDKWESLEDQGDGYNPQLYKCTDAQPICSTD